MYYIENCTFYNQVKIYTNVSCCLYKLKFNTIVLKIYTDVLRI